MIARKHEDAASFLARVEPLLLRDEAENGMQLGVLGALARGHGNAGLLLEVSDETDVTASATWTPPRALILSRAPDAALDVIARHAVDAGLDLPGVVAEASTALRFAERYAAMKKTTMRIAFRQGVYRLNQLIAPVRWPAGRRRLASPGDICVVADWLVAFSMDAHMTAPSRDDALRDGAARIAADSVLLWDDEGPVSMAIRTGRTRSTERLGFVYTPRALRGHGYATAVVAELTRAISEDGRSSVLYTDLANPTSNAIYRRLGYEQFVESTMIAFGEHEL